MSPRTLHVLLAGMMLSGVVLGTPLLAQGPATVVIVIDDTQVRPGDGPRVAELIDTLERDLLGASGAFGIVSVGPAGLNIDLTRERRRLREVSEAARAGHLDFALPPNPEMAAGARVAALEGVISGLAKRPGPRAVVVVGRATPVAERRRAKWLALRRHADSMGIAWAWFDLGRENCQASASTDASLAAKGATCASVLDASANRRGAPSTGHPPSSLNQEAP